MKQYIKDNKIKFRKEIIIHINGKQIINPTEEQVLNNGWEEYVTPELTDIDKLNNAKRDMQHHIEHYDSSSEVNEFTVNDIPMWLDKATRVGLKLRFETEIEDGETETTLWYNGVAFPLEINMAVKMLHAIEKYASRCYDNTQRHIGCVKQLENIEDIQNYDYRSGYPDKLHF